MKRSRKFISLAMVGTMLVSTVTTTWSANIKQRGEQQSIQRVRRDLGEKGQIVIESLDLNNADISDVVRMLARIAGLNIITGDIRGSITVYLENVTVQDALEAILASQGYGFIFDGNIVRVMDAAQLGEDRVETITETFLLNYLPAETVADNLKNVFSTASGGNNFSQIEANSESNALIVVDVPRRVDEIRKLVRVLDQRFDQVEIEGRFVEISYTQKQEWGVDWQYFQDPANSLDVNLAPGALNASNIAGQYRFAIINSRDNLTGFIQALEQNNDAKILANPKILALENKEAKIELINALPYVETNVSQGVITESVQFQETGIRLVVTPVIAYEPQGIYIRMTLELEQRIAGERVVLQNSSAFSVDSRRAESDLIVPDESTVVIGGLRSDDIKYTYDKIPFLGDIPFLGNAFKKRIKDNRQTELLLFVTPRVVMDHPALDCIEHELHDEIDERADSLRTQAHWRDTVEAPVEGLQKQIKYSGVLTNQNKYQRDRAARDQIEGVKPYRVRKDLGDKAQYRITAEGNSIEVEELPPREETDKKTADFSVIEQKAKPSQGPRQDAWFLEQPEEDVIDEELPLVEPVMEPVESDAPSATESEPVEQSQPTEESEEAEPRWNTKFSSDAEQPDNVDQNPIFDGPSISEIALTEEPLFDAESGVAESDIVPEVVTSAAREQDDFWDTFASTESDQVSLDPWAVGDEDGMDPGASSQPAMNEDHPNTSTNSRQGSLQSDEVAALGWPTDLGVESEIAPQNMTKQVWPNVDSSNNNSSITPSQSEMQSVYTSTLIQNNGDAQSSSNRSQSRWWDKVIPWR